MVDRMLGNVVVKLMETPQHYARWASLLLHELYPYYEIAIVGKDSSSLLQEINTSYFPNTFIAASTNASKLPFFNGKYEKQKTIIYVCEKGTCKLPVETVQEAVAQMNVP